jgi:succinate dehydrogenase/fumarate reductase flavoprotein subunit
MLAHEKLGPLREAGPCAEAIAEFERMESEDIPRMRLSPQALHSERARGRDLESALSLGNLALLGRLLATAALKREESRGAHFRLDFPEVDNDNWRAVTRLRRSAKGGIEFRADKVAG